MIDFLAVLSIRLAIAVLPRRLHEYALRVFKHKRIDWSPRLLFFWFYLKTAQERNSAGINAGTKVILYIVRSVFAGEIDYLKSRSNHTYIPMSANLLASVFGKKFQDSQGVSDLNYHEHTSEHRAEVEALFQYWICFLRLAKRHLQIDCIVSSNFHYRVEVEFQNSCVELDLPLVILYREGIMPNQTLETHLHNYRNTKFIGNKILFYNSTLRERFFKIEGITAENSEVIGFPLADHLVNSARERHNSAGTKVATLFLTFLEDRSYPNGYQLFPEDYRTSEIVELVEQFYVDFVRLSETFPDWTFNVKIKKNAFSHLNYWEQLREKADISSADNLSVYVSSQRTAADLILSSQIVAGWSSTTLVESIAANRIVIEPAVLQGNMSNEMSILGEFEGASTLVSSINEMRNIFLRPDEYKPDLEARQRMIKKFFAFDDGQSYRRFNKELDEVLTTTMS